MNTQIEASVTNFRLISKLQDCTSIEKNQILMTLRVSFSFVIQKVMTLRDILDQHNIRSSLAAAIGNIFSIHRPGKIYNGVAS